MQCEGCTLFSVQDGPVYQTYFKASRTELSDHCLNSRAAWNSGFYYQKANIDGCFCLVSDGGVFTTPHLTWPLGVETSEALEGVLDALYPAFSEKNWPLRLMYIDAFNLPLVEGLSHYRCSISHNLDYSDYIYDADKLRQLSGKALHGKRNHYNQFCRTYPEFEYRPISPSDEEDALAIVKSWCDEKNVDCMNLCESDYRAIRRLFHDMPELDVRGGSIRIGGKMVAFALGSFIRDDTAVIHFEKAESNYVGLYAAINKLVLEHAFPDATWVNREEDMGMLGLRKAKESYGPVRMIPKYEALLTRIEE